MRQIYPGDPDYPRRAKPYKFRIGTIVKGANGPAKVVSMGRGRDGVHVVVKDRSGNTSVWLEGTLERAKPTKKRNPEGVSILATYGASDAGKHAVLDQALDIAERAKSLPVPHVGSRISQLGGAHRAGVAIAISLDPKSVWANGIFENSRHARFMVRPDEGTIDLIQGWKVPKFRKARFKTPAEAIAKIAKWVREAGVEKKNPAKKAKRNPQRSFNPIDYFWTWTKDWYDWDRTAAIKAARTARDAEAKKLAASGYKPRKWSLSNQRIRRGGIGSGHPEIDEIVTVFMLDY